MYISNWVDNAIVSSCMFYVGHTKLFRDAGFGKMKPKFWITKVGFLNGIASVMQTSITVKYSQPVDDQQNNSYYE